MANGGNSNIDEDPHAGLESPGGTSRDHVIDGWVRRYGEPLRRFFLKRGVTPAEAEDLTQEVYVRIARMDGVDAIREPEAFLFQTASNLLKDHVRRAHSHQARNHVSIEDGQLPTEVSAPDRVLVGKQSLEGVLRVVDGLPSRQRDVFVLHRFDGMTYTQIAEHLGISASAVEKHMMKAIARIHQYLEDW